MSVRRNYGENDKLETIGIRTFYKFMVRNSFYKNQDTFSQKSPRYPIVYLLSLFQDPGSCECNGSSIL